MVRSQQGRHEAADADPTSVLAVFIGHGVHTAAPLLSLYEPVWGGESIGVNDRNAKQRVPL